jgi:hypothetical protein
MTLDEAIEHAEWCARESQGECSGEHMQLGEWLRELRRLRTQSKWLRKEYTSLRKTREREFAASCGAATNSMGQIGTLRDKNAELRELVRDMWRDGMCDCDEQYACAECEYGYPKRMKDLGIEIEVDE